MNVKQMLMASTALLLLGTQAVPLSAQTAQPDLRVAQAAPPALMDAIQAYREAEDAVAEAEASGGDTDAAQAAFESARTELSQLCAAVGQEDIEACLALFENGQLPAAEPAPEPEEAAPEAEPLPEPEPEVAPEEPAPEPEAQDEPADEPETQDEAVEEPPVQQEPAPDESAAEEPDTGEPTVEEPAIEEPAIEEEPVDTSPAEPAPQEDASEDDAAPETDTPAETLDEPTDTDTAAPIDGPAAPRPMLDAVEAYRSATTEDERAAAEAELAAICEAVGQPDIPACLAAFGIELDLTAPLDETVPDEATPEDAAPAQEPDDATEAEDAVEGDEEDITPPPAPEPQPEPELQDDIVLEDGDAGEIVPEGVNPDEVAPLLDSEKDSAAEAAAAAQEPADTEVQADPEVDAEAEAEVAAEAEEEQTIPESDADAQAQAQITVEEIEPITAEEGQRRRTRPEGTATGEPELLGRVQRETPTNLEIITTIGLATVFAIGASQFIDTPDTPRIIENNFDDYWIEDLPGGRTREVVLRRDGSQLVTIRDRYGDIIRRSRIEPDGREILLVYVDPNYRRYDEQGRWIDPGRELPPLRLRIPPREYVLDAAYADERQVARFLDQPPVESIQRYYTLDEVKRSSRIRDMVRRLEIGDLTFATGSATIPQDQLSALSAVAYAMLDLLEQNPAETFLIEGHTDAVGSELSNLELSDRRAESVAYALTRVYGIPPENLATQGYGERYLKINTQAAERLNRRVTIRRITPLITPIASR